MTSNILTLIMSLLISGLELKISSNLHGAWKSDNGVIILTDNYFSYASFGEAEFYYTYGGSWHALKDKLIFKYEYHTENPSLVGNEQSFEFFMKEENLNIGQSNFKRIDAGKPGSLFGAWLFSNRVSNGEMGTPRSADNPRKTMKILSGTRFQWIAYNIDTKEFMGSGGGTYTTDGGKYIERIDFFSRDNSRVGASLDFDYNLKENDWHHKGFSSKGDPIYEIWSLRK